MSTFWWAFTAFVGGGSAGVLVMALMCMAGGQPKQSAHVSHVKAWDW